MKTLSFITVLLFCASMVAHAQKSKVTTAESLLLQKKLEKAKETIDEAIKHENCINYAKAHLVRGKIYQGIFEQDSVLSKQIPDLLNVAWEEYQTTIKLDDKNKLEKELRMQFLMLAIDFVNQGVNNFNAEKPDKALENFKRSLEIHASPYGSQKVDTLTIHYASVTARKIGRWEEAVELFKKLLDLDFKEINVHAAIASTLLEWSREAKTAGDTLLATSKQGEALKYLKEGIEKYPTNEFMLVELINYYLLDGDNPEQAEPYLDAAIKQYPERAEFYRVKGALFERLKQLDKAEEMYRKTLEIDPTEFTAQYQLGGILLDRVSEEHQRVNEIENVKVYNAEIDKVMKKYEEVLPYFERALELKPTDKSALTMLSKIYFMLRNRPNTNYQKKFDQMQERLKQ